MVIYKSHQQTLNTPNEGQACMFQGQDSESSEASRGEAGDAAADKPKPLSTNPESVTKEAR